MLLLLILVQTLLEAKQSSQSSKKVKSTRMELESFPDFDESIYHTRTLFDVCDRLTLTVSNSQSSARQ